MVIAFLLTLGVAMIGWFRPTQTKSTVPPTYTNQQVSEAKASVCAAYGKAHHAVLANTGRSGDNDPATLLGLAANARIALFDSGAYLFRVLAEQPATAADLGDATRNLAKSYQDLALNYMAEASDSELEASRQTVEAAGTRVSELCK
ncbi:hypothetical protein [Mycobacterium kubicae]|uniref:hypothetical protein n=1 Tax=Mycobacterium kubicae TaxID=120959 RepID=UPI0010423E22|nr:hypothetical protein [Mycobacterium kubicae]